MQKDLTLESLDKSLEQSKKAELEKQQQIELESMSEFQKSLKTSLQTELDLIKEDIYEVQKFLNKKNETLTNNAEIYSKQILESFQNVNKEMSENFQNANKELTKIKAKQWIIPTVMGLVLVLALALGTWGVTKYLESQLLALGEVRAEIGKAKRVQDKYVIKSWSNAIGVKNEPKTWKDLESGLWIVQFEKSN